MTADRLDEKALEENTLDRKCREAFDALLRKARSEGGRADARAECAAYFVARMEVQDDAVARALRASRASTGTDPGAREASPEDGCGGPQESCIPCRNPKRHETYRCPECTVVWCEECSGVAASPARAESDPASVGCDTCGVKGWPHYDRLATGAWVCAECHYALTPLNRSMNGTIPQPEERRSLSPGPDPREAAREALTIVAQLDAELRPDFPDDATYVVEVPAGATRRAREALRALSSPEDAT